MSEEPIILLPSAAADAVCHEEQIVVWTGDMVGMLNLGGWLRDGIDYSESLELHEAIGRELRSIIEAAFDHPEAKTIKRSRP